MNDKLRITTGTNFILKMISSRIFLTSTIFALLVVFCHQESLHESSHLIKEDYVEYERPKETLSETIFHKKIRGLIYLPKTVPKWILDIIPFYGKNFKTQWHPTQSSESSDYERNLMSKVYEAPVKASKGRKVEKRSSDFNIPFIARCEFQDCVTDAVKIFPMRNAFPPMRIFRRWIGLDPVPVIEKLDKTESHLEKVKKDHEENIEGLRAKLEKLQDQQSEE